MKENKKTSQDKEKKTFSWSYGIWNCKFLKGEISWNLFIINEYSTI